MSKPPKVSRQFAVEEDGWEIREHDGHLLLILRSNQEWKLALTHHAAAMLAHDLWDAIDADKAQVTFRWAVENSKDLSAEDKAHWLAACDEEGL